MKVISILPILGILMLIHTPKANAFPKMILSSPDFENQGVIPVEFSCQGVNVNPALEIQGVPEGVKSLALIVDDPDAPSGDWVHWVVFNIPAEQRTIEKGAVPGIQGVNDFRTINYGGPCPPSGPPHRYFFKIYALDTMLTLSKGVTKKQLEKAMIGHVLDQAQIIGLYQTKN
ncbi:MAG: YbhB/YbcL family Raf kinase inhibitor-like protein [Candidatus Omnitrophica bacterium]|nr:YbhB/YbcL family Raf kinase inhibitor-like protein [Candidatus Omnitrophota bacterium]